jgi:hypothetical protein
MKQSARLIIPVWGEKYLEKILSVTLPAVLAPGNLAALSEFFEVELTLVTESRFFESIRASRAFKAVTRLCKVKFIPLDDLLTDNAGDYGIVLTYALFRGFADLGERMTETYLLFLNADFIISDGSLRHLAQLMYQGERLIHAPSFRVVLEDVWPRLLARVDTDTGTLDMGSCEMAKLALTHRHQTVKARTVNQRLYHQKWMDQFYWYVDEDTMICYQSPVALVAIKPERIIVDPVLVWDFAFIPEAAPTLVPHFISDSDNFFMIEPQSEATGREMMRIGWLPIEEIAGDLSLWLTKAQRESSKQLLKIHAGDLPAATERVIEESRAFMARVYGLMSPEPASHIRHPRLGGWFAAAKGGRRALRDATKKPADKTEAMHITHVEAVRSQPNLAAMVLLRLQAIYRRIFGSPPEIGKCHPLWTDLSIDRKFEEWQRSENCKILRMKADDWRRGRLSGAVDSAAGHSFLQGAPYDACICDLAFDELADVEPLYAELRPLMNDGGQVVFKTVRSTRLFAQTELFLDSCNFPDIDISEIHFYGTAAVALLQALYIRSMRPVPTRPIVRAISLCALILLAPIVRLANARAARRDSEVFSRTWTSLVIKFQIKRRREPKAESQPNRGRMIGAPPL